MFDLTNYVNLRILLGHSRIKKGSHRVYKMPWPGDPRINIQNHKGKAKIYQVKQVLKAIIQLEKGNDSEN